jgi:hypothetical protein
VNNAKGNERFEMVRTVCLLISRIAIYLIRTRLVLVLTIQTISSIILAMILLSFAVSSLFIWTLRMTHTRSINPHYVAKIVARAVLYNIKIKLF